MDGPVTLSTIGSACLLVDGRVVTGSPTPPLTILGVDLDDEPVTVDGTDGLGLRWTEDGMSVWTAPEDGPIRLAAHPDRRREIACEIVNRELTAEEWRTFVSETEPQVDACP